MAKNERDHIAVGKDSSHGRHGGNRAGDQHEDDRPQQSSRAAGKDPHRGGRPSGGRPKPS